MKKTVLIIDEEKGLTYLFEKMLEDKYVTYTADSFPEAARIFKDKKDEIDLVIMEMTMRTMSATDIVLYFQKIKPKIKFFIVVASFNQKTFEDLSGNGCIGFLGKPFKAGDLLNEIEKVLE